MKAIFELKLGEQIRTVVIEQENEHTLAIRPVGYGDHNTVDGQGAPIILELWDHPGGDPLQMHVWSEISQEDPTHSISLAGARESARQEEQ